MLGLISKDELVVYMSDSFMITTHDGNYYVYTPNAIHIVDNEMFRRSIKILGVNEYEIRSTENMPDQD